MIDKFILYYFLSEMRGEIEFQRNHQVYFYFYLQIYFISFFFVTQIGKNSLEAIIRDGYRTFLRRSTTALQFFVPEGQVTNHRWDVEQQRQVSLSRSL